MTAHVELVDGSDFVAEIANLTPHSLFVRTTRRLDFRTKVTVTFFSVSIQGEVAFVSRSPEGIVVSFEPTPAMLPLVLARIPEIEVLDPGAEPGPPPVSLALPPRARSGRGAPPPPVTPRKAPEEPSVPTDLIALPELGLAALVEESTVPAYAPMKVGAAAAKRAPPRKSTPPRGRADTVADGPAELASTILDLPAQKLPPSKGRGRPPPVKSKPAAARQRPPPSRLPPKRS